MHSGYIIPQFTFPFVSSALSLSCHFPLWMQKSIILYQISSMDAKIHDTILVGKDSWSGKTIPFRCDFGGKLESLMLLSIH